MVAASCIAFASICVLLLDLSGTSAQLQTFVMRTAPTTCLRPQKSQITSVMAARACTSWALFAYNGGDFTVRHSQTGYCVTMEDQLTTNIANCAKYTLQGTEQRIVRSDSLCLNPHQDPSNNKWTLQSGSCSSSISYALSSSKVTASTVPFESATGAELDTVPTDTTSTTTQDNRPKMDDPRPGNRPTRVERVSQGSMRTTNTGSMRMVFDGGSPVCPINKHYCPNQCEGHLNIVMYRASADGEFACGLDANAQSVVQPCVAPVGSPHQGDQYFACVCPTAKFCTRTKTCCSPTTDRQLPKEWFIWGARCTQCNLSNTTGLGDPHFTGFDGSTFEFLGYHGGIFNLISEQDHLVNAMFDNMGQTGSTFISKIGFKYKNLVAMEIGTDLDECGTDSNMRVPILVRVNNVLAFNSMRNSTHPFDSVVTYRGGLRVQYVHEPQKRDIVRVYSKTIYMVIVKLYSSCHLDVSFNRHINPDDSSDGMMHGIIGQTILWDQGVNKDEGLVGDETDYVVSGLFASDFTYNLFMEEHQPEPAVLNFVQPVVKFLNAPLQPTA